MVELVKMYPPAVNSVATTIMGALDASTTQITVLDGTVLPKEESLLVIGTGNDAETVLLTAWNFNTLTVQRGVQGTAKAWEAGTPIARNFTAKDLEDVQENITRINEGTGYKLLWQNPNGIYSGFTEQQVTLSESLFNYDFFVVVFVSETLDGGYDASGLFPVIDTGTFYTLSNNWMEGGGQMQGRRLQHDSASSIYFYGGKSMSASATTVSVSNTACIPYRVYGIKLGGF